jgi:hypothetical protein
MRPPLGQHFDSALIDPVEDAKLVREGGVVCGVKVTESGVLVEAREIVLTLALRTYCWSHAAAASRYLFPTRVAVLPP